MKINALSYLHDNHPNEGQLSDPGLGTFSTQQENVVHPAQLLLSTVGNGTFRRLIHNRWSS